MTDPKLIEAVARAICQLHGIDPEWPASHFGTERCWQEYADWAERIVTAYEAARGDGVWVPVEPTPAMWDAGAAVLYGHPREKAEEWAKTDKFEAWGDAAERAYREMIAAAKGE